MWVCFRCGGILSCSDWDKIVILFPLHCMNFESYAAHRTPPLSAVCCKKQQQQKTPRVQQCTSSLPIPCAHGKLNVKHLRNRRYIYTWYHSRESRSCAGEKSNTKTNTSGAAAAVRVRMYTSEADFHKPRIYGGSVRVRATAWDVFRRAPSRVGRGGRAAVDFVMCIGWGGFFSFFFSFLMRQG